jgi:hypothetical protein
VARERFTVLIDQAAPTREVFTARSARISWLLGYRLATGPVRQELPGSHGDFAPLTAPADLARSSGEGVGDGVEKFGDGLDGVPG